jgi:hypothetical protein
VLQSGSQQAQSIKIFTTTRLAVTDVWDLSAPAIKLLSG